MEKGVGKRRIVMRKHLCVVMKFASRDYSNSDSRRSTKINTLQMIYSPV